MAQRKNKEMKMKFVTVYLPSKKKKKSYSLISENLAHVSSYF